MANTEQKTVSSDRWLLVRLIPGSRKRHVEACSPVISELHFLCRVRSDVLDGVTVKPLLKLYNRVHEAIRDISRDHPVDLLVIGARGRKSHYWP